MLEVKGLCKHFPMFQMRSIDLKVNAGSVVAIMGHNGSGKSILFQLLMGLLKPDAGKIHWFQQASNENRHHIQRRIGYVGDLLHAFEHLTIQELADFAARWYPKWNWQTFHSLCKRYELNSQAQYQDCSTGTQKKVEFVLALSYDPDFLLLDEPTRGVDLPTQKKMIDDVSRHMEAEQKGVLFTSHQLEDLQRLADEIVIIHQGSMVESFLKDDVQERWGMLWLDQDLSESQAEQHPHILEQRSPRQLVTDERNRVEADLEKWGIHIHHVETLSLIEITEYMIHRKVVS